MKREFSEQLDAYVTQAGLSLRQMAGQSGIPHQTLFNWLKGSQPRLHKALPDDLRRLGITLDLTDDEISLLLHLAGCTAARSERLLLKEMTMESQYRIPKGWFITGDAPSDYVLGVDPGCSYENQPCVTIKAGPDASEFAALAQQIKAEAYHGQRLRFSAMLSSEALINRAALFMRIGDASGNMLAFDNMRERYITGTTEWSSYAIVLDVTEQAEDIVFGLLSSLAGQVWMTDVRLEVVQDDIPSTDILADIAHFFPTNLDFTE